MILSLFTQGFDFSSPTGAAGLSLQEAEQKALTFVNQNLVHPDLPATAEYTEEVAGLYKVTLSYAGETIETYLSKDGNVFFPQGFDTATSLQEKPEEVELSPETEQPAEPVEQPIEQPSEESVEEPAAEEQPAETPTEEPTQPEMTTEQHSLTYKKWTFSSQELKVKQGSKIALTLTPDTSKEDFALNSFTFAIPDLNIEQEISGEATVEFDATQAGTFEFVCSSCKGTQAAVMKGQLIVE